MSFPHFTIRAAVLLFPLFCAEPILGQEITHHPCFEQPNGALNALRRLPESARDWLAEDAVYIITPEERCAFLRLNTDKERDQFIELFWYRRTVDSTSPDHDFKTEHYRRIVFANEKYGGPRAGWKTDRGRIYVLFGPPDSVDLVAGQRAPGAAPNQDSDTYLHPAEQWHYRYIKGIGENVEFHFESVAGRADYALAAPGQNLLERADLNPVLDARPPKIRFKDLEALLTARIVRDQVKFSHRIEFTAATHATTLARVDIQIPCEACTHDSRVVPSVAYPVFIRVSKPSGWVVYTSELTANAAEHGRSDSGLTLTAHFDVPLAPGNYQLAIAAKNATTGETGVLLTRLGVPTDESLGTKN
jgi:GWxTD domain-containing protein